MASSSDSVTSPATVHPPALESDLPIWFSCAGAAVEIPLVNSQVYYFVQGHAEHTSAAGIPVDLELIKAVPDRVLCRVIAVEYGADYHTDEVYAKICLKPVDEPIESDSTFVNNAFCERATMKLTSTNVYTRTLDITRELDQMIPLTGDDMNREFICQDLHGNTYLFNRTRQQLIYGCSKLMTVRDLHVDDTVSFMRGTHGQIIVGVWRAKPTVKKFVSADLVLAAAWLAASGEAFKVYYYPRIGTQEFVVNAPRVEASIRRILRYVRINTEVDYEDPFTLQHRGTVVTTEAPYHPQHWPDSPWKRLQVRVVLKTLPEKIFFRDTPVSAWMVTNIQVPEDSQNPPVPANENDPSGSGSNPTAAQVFTFNDKPIL